VHLVTVPQPGAPRDELWQRYCRAFGIESDWAPDEAGRENVSIGAAETALLRKLNRRLRQAGLPAEDYRRLVRQLMVHETLAHRQNMTKALIPPASLPWANEVTDEWVEWVEGAGIDVIGDLKDLRPAAPLEPDEWENPDSPPRQEMVDAALDALVAMTLEAARRPDPDEQITARIGRAARRLRGQ
jgi:hypothetical protein